MAETTDAELIAEALLTSNLLVSGALFHEGLHQNKPTSDKMRRAAETIHRLVNALEAAIAKPAPVQVTNQETLARWLHMRFGRNQSKVWDQLSERLRRAWLDMAGDAPSCTSQPAPVQVTDEMVERGAKALFEESQELGQDNSWDDDLPDDWRAEWLNASRAVLTDALGDERG